jgi:hypothetical protein
MAIQLAGNRLLVYEYLKRISPEWATLDDIQKNTGIQPPQQILQIVKLLLSYSIIGSERGHFREHEWAFSIRPGFNTTLDQILQAKVAPPSKPEPYRDPAEDPLAVDFQRRAESAMSQQFGLAFQKAVPAGVPKKFSLVSINGEVIGEAIYFPPGDGEHLLQPRCSVITENVWLLEKTKIRRKFLVFNSQRQILIDWLERFGSLVNYIEFFLLEEDGTLELLNLQL